MEPLRIDLTFSEECTRQLQDGLKRKEVDPDDLPELVLGDVRFCRGDTVELAFERVPVPELVARIPKAFLKVASGTTDVELTHDVQQCWYAYVIRRGPNDVEIHYPIPDSRVRCSVPELARALCEAIEATMDYLRKHFSPYCRIEAEDFWAWLEEQLASLRSLLR